MTPAISKEKADVAATETEHDNDNDTETTLNDDTTVNVDGWVLESTFGDQARAGDVLTDTILHGHQERSSVEVGGGSSKRQQT
jgi:hypothetical protein